MKVYQIILLIISVPMSLLSQENKKLPKSNVNYDSFLEISEEVRAYRESRLVSLHQFLDFMKDPETVLLDTRSKAAYDKKHLKGAIHLNFSDFTTEKLLQLLPDKKTRILIYCNNNFDGDRINFPTKTVSLALNIPTFINLVGYGYKNVYELSALVPIQDKRLIFTGTTTE